MDGTGDEIWENRSGNSCNANGKGRNGAGNERQLMKNSATHPTFHVCMLNKIVLMNESFYTHC